ncbi:MAG: hypothetical protein KAY37_09505 [Phycisphaerae bacterium]|nr:hypothetical protein [Phycisphaerae bacterium]
MAALALSGCALGPAALRNSRQPYNEVIQRTTNEQLLLNLVRLQYRESPLFLEIGSVAAQFSFRQSASIDGTINENIPYEAINPDELGLGAQFGYEEKPTITFTPLQGDEFVSRLLEPVKIDTILLLAHSGWSVDRVLRLTVQGMNGLDNASRASGPTPAEAPDFERFARAAALLRELQLAGIFHVGYEAGVTELSEPIAAAAVTSADMLAAAAAGYRFRSASDGKVVLTGPSKSLTWRVRPMATPAPALDELIELLGLEPGLDKYAVQPGLDAQITVAGRRKSIDIATRSLMGTLFYLSQAVEVPARHRELGLVTTTVDEEGRPFDWAHVTGDLLRIHASPCPPRGAAVAVRYRGHWFHIDDADLTSKSTFGLLGQLFALQAGREVSGGPTLTLPIGG